MLTTLIVVSCRCSLTLFWVQILTCMKKLWNWIDREPLPTEEKYTLCLRILGAFWALMGFLLWLVLELVCRPGLTWLVILTGYPLLVAPILVFLYGCRHPFR